VADSASNAECENLPLWMLTRALNMSTLRIPDSSWRFLAVNVAIAIAMSILALKYVETPYRTSLAISMRRRIK